MEKDRNYSGAERLMSFLYEFSDNLTLEEKIPLLKVYEQLLLKSSVNNSDAMYELAQLYEKVSFLTPNIFRNDKKKFYWYNKAAYLNHPEACNELAVLYENGKVCDRSLSRALMFYHKGAKLKSKLSRDNLKLFKKQIKNKEHKYFKLFRKELAFLDNEEKNVVNKILRNKKK